MLSIMNTSPFQNSMSHWRSSTNAIIGVSGGDVHSGGKEECKSFLRYILIFVNKEVKKGKQHAKGMNWSLGFIPYFYATVWMI